MTNNMDAKWTRGLMVVTGVCVAAQLACERKPKLDDDKAKVSYAIGQTIAKNLKAQNIELDPKVVAYGLSSGLKGEKPSLTEEEQRKAIMGLQQRAQEKAKAEAEKAKAGNVEFLEKNKAKEGVKTTASGLQYEVIKEGKGKKPTLKDKVRVHYTGTLTNGTKFDSSRDNKDGKPIEFPLNGIIRGWQEALQLMPEGSTYKLYIPPELGYGPQPQPGIPANSVLVFEVELIKIVK